MTPVFKVENRVGFRRFRSLRRVVDGVSFSIAPASSWASSARAARQIGHHAGCHGPPATSAVIEADPRIELNGRDLTGANERQWAAIRGDEISMVFQNP